MVPGVGYYWYRPEHAFVGGLWILRLWIGKATECFTCLLCLMYQPNINMENTGAEGGLNCADLAQNVKVVKTFN